MTKEEIQEVIELKQQEMPFDAKARSEALPISGSQIVTLPGVRRCGKSTRMELAINDLLKKGVPRENILWIGFDDERFVQLAAKDLDLILDAYREMFPEIPLKDVWMFFDELPLVEGWELFALRVYKSYCKHIFICGSNAHTLSKEMKSELRGWPVEFETFPLSFAEKSANQLERGEHVGGVRVYQHAARGASEREPEPHWRGFRPARANVPPPDVRRVQGQPRGDARGYAPGHSAHQASD